MKTKLILCLTVSMTVGIQSLVRGDDFAPMDLEVRLRQLMPEIRRAQYVATSDFRRALGVAWCGPRATPTEWQRTMIYFDKSNALIRINTDAQNKLWLDEFDPTTGNDPLCRLSAPEGGAMRRVLERVTDCIDHFEDPAELHLFSTSATPLGEPTLIAALGQRKTGAISFGTSETATLMIDRPGEVDVQAFSAQLTALPRNSIFVVLGTRATVALNSSNANFTIRFEDAIDDKMTRLLTTNRTFSTSQLLARKVTLQDKKIIPRNPTFADGENGLEFLIRMIAGKELKTNPRFDPMLWLMTAP